MSKAAREHLDRVQHTRDIDGFEVDRFRALLGGDPGAASPALDGVGATLDELHGLLAEVDRFASKCMRILLVQDPRAIELPDKLRIWAVAMVASFAGDPGALGERIRSSLSRSPSARETAVAVEEVATRVLALRAALHQAVRDYARGIANGALGATGRPLPADPAERQRARLARKDLELVAADPRRLGEGRLEDRLRALPPLPDEPDPEPAPTIDRFAGLEVD